MKSFMSNISRVFLIVLAIFLFGKKVNANEVCYMGFGIK